MCNRSSKLSNTGSLPVVAAMWLISPNRVSATARRVEGRRRGFGDLAGRVVGRVDQAVVLGMPVEAAQSGDQVLTRAAPATCVTPGDHGDLHVLDQLLDLRGGWFVEVPVAPVLLDAVPVGAVDPAGAVGDGGGDEGMYSAKVGTGGRTWGAARRSAGERPIRARSIRAASSSATLAVDAPVVCVVT